MNVIEVLLIARAAGLVLERRGDQIVVRGLKPTAPPELLAMLRDHKPELLALMNGQTPAPLTSTTDQRVRSDS